ncbi:Uncharacterized protein AC496_0421 [Pseudomonas savastanoi pv. glycinea]|uniref:Uncharacterized protein n=1 Tax=Pseudomonas savastanoi pv. glycinea TaxID=318 RepID=A0ABR5LEU0_PSESG|nr:hypothetical protein [Pseudomonas savastanoi]EFW77315.1 hypothetical protein PsgB076_29230 [Pseudomonas savastanoi pv. glycinea str. B076]KPC36334.1 Uncharacterized protein AC497_0616 [Pseudomonas savastanoi pv. glycinea]KPC45984.1 Uncharacterized protein AC496_0421 [Pseudomonas savastanoi pv. glycinea]
MNASMTAICVMWAGFTFLFYRGLYLRRVRHAAYAEFARATFAAVQAHFPELKSKSSSLVIDKGFGVKDDEAWQDALHTFISHRVVPELPPRTRESLKASPSARKDFSTLTVNLVLTLVAHQSMPETYDLTEVIDSIEQPEDAITFLSGTPKFKPHKEVLTRLAAAVLAIGLMGGTSASYAASGEAFSPLSACNALADIDGFQPSKSGYIELYDGIFSCATPYKELGKQVLPNNIALYGRGTASEVTRVKLMLNVNVSSLGARDTKLLASLCTKMITHVVGTPTSGLEQKIAQGKPFNQPFYGYNVYLDKTVWGTGKGYELNCGIATQNNKE